MAAAHLLQGGQHRVARDAQTAEEVTDSAGDVGHREQEVLGGQVVVAELGALGIRSLEHRVTVGGQLGLLRGLPVDLGEPRQQLVDPVAHDLARHADALEHGQHHALGLRHEGGEQVLGRDLGVVALPRERLGGTQRFARLVRQLVGVERHTTTSESAMVSKVDNNAINFIPGWVPERERGSVPERARAGGEHVRGPGVETPGPPVTRAPSGDQPVNAGWISGIGAGAGAGAGVTVAPSRFTNA